MKILQKTFILIIFLFLLNPYKVNAESVTLTARVGDTALVLNGYTVPNILITFIEDDIVVGTAISNNLGEFTKTFTAQEAGYHSLKIYYTDPTAQTSNTIQLMLLLIDFQTLTVSDIYLPPTIRIDKTNYTVDQNITISGYAKPNELIEIQISGAVGRYSVVNSNSDGFYTYSFPTTGFVPGIYSVNASIKTDLSTNTPSSNTLNFTFYDSENNAYIIPESNNGLCPYPYRRLCYFDKGIKGYLDLINDLPDLLLGFVKFNGDNNKNSPFDINESGVINGEDFSIALFYTQKNPSKVLGVTDNKATPEIYLSNNPIKFINDFEETHGTHIIMFIEELIGPQLLIGVIAVLIFILLIIGKSKKDGRNITKQHI